MYIDIDMVMYRSVSVPEFGLQPGLPQLSYAPYAQGIVPSGRRIAARPCGSSGSKPSTSYYWGLIICLGGSLINTVNHGT